MSENLASEFITNSEHTALALYFCLKKDGHKPRHYSGLQVIEKEGFPTRNFHLHHVYLEVAEEILRSYINYEKRRLPGLFADSRFVVQACAVLNTMPQKLRLLRPWPLVPA